MEWLFWLKTNFVTPFIHVMVLVPLIFLLSYKSSIKIVHTRKPSVSKNNFLLLTETEGLINLHMYNRECFHLNDLPPKGHFLFTFILCRGAYVCKITRNSKTKKINFPPKPFVSKNRINFLYWAQQHFYYKFTFNHFTRPHKNISCTQHNKNQSSLKLRLKPKS